MVRIHKRAALAAASLGLAALSPAAPAAVGVDSSALRAQVTPAEVKTHMAAFDAIATANPVGGVPTRAAGTPGYEASVQYVKDQLATAGGYFTVREQAFAFDFFSENSPPAFEQVSPSAVGYAEGTDFATMDYSGAGDVTGLLVPTNDIVIPPGAQASTSNSGCEVGDFVDVTAVAEPRVALVQRGTCDFGLKAVNAATAGYDAVVIFNEGQADLGRVDVLFGTLGDFRPGIPVIGTSFPVGEALYQADGSGEVVVRVRTDTTIVEDLPTKNLIADTTAGRPDRTVVVGAHLDSVPEGPGVQDNGSGSAANLEVALEMAENGIRPRNRVRFAWWGAEEAGLVGSQFYVDGLSAREVKDIAVNLNFDMIASPNFARFIYDGDGSDTDSLASTGSGVVEDVFAAHFDRLGLAHQPTAFDGRSDYDAFVSVGIPAGGLFTGAEEIKSPAEVLLYGGTAGIAYDPCYHAACDTLANVSDTALDEQSDAVAHGVLTFAQTTSAVQGTDKGKGAGGRYDPVRLGSHLRK